MYSTIQEAWNNDHIELYTNNFKQSKFNTSSSNNNYFNIHENYGTLIPKTKKSSSTKNNLQSTISNKSLSSQKIKSTHRVRNKSSTRQVRSKSSTKGYLRSTTVNPIIRSIKNKIKCKDIIKHVKKCKKCRKKLEKYINKNKIVIDMNPIEVRKMLLCLILIGMFIMLFNMLTEMRSKK
jgi:hypothetical protein